MLAKEGWEAAKSGGWYLTSWATWLRSVRFSTQARWRYRSCANLYQYIIIYLLNYIISDRFSVGNENRVELWVLLLVVMQYAKGINRFPQKMIYFFAAKLLDGDEWHKK